MTMNRNGYLLLILAAAMVFNSLFTESVFSVPVRNIISGAGLILFQSGGFGGTRAA